MLKILAKEKVMEIVSKENNNGMQARENEWDGQKKKRYRILKIDEILIYLFESFSKFIYEHISIQ